MTYSERPELYDVVYGFKDYAGESERVEQLVRARSPAARTLLDVACGTGKHLEHLRSRFACEGVDLDPGLLAIARRRLPGVPLRQADMRQLDLGRTFDVVTCLFSAIGFVLDLDALERTAESLAGHLAPGGVLLIEPWIEPDAFVPGRPSALSADEAGLAVARVALTSRAERISAIEMHYLVGTAAGIEPFTERHELGLFTRQEMRAALERTGLEVEYDEQGLMGRGLWLGKRGA